MAPIITAPSSPPVNVTAEAISPTLAKLTWEPPDPEHRNGRVQEYAIIRVILHSGELQELVSSNTEMVLEDLHPYTKYFFLVAARTVSLGPFSLQEFLHMPEAGEKACKILSIQACSYTMVPLLVLLIERM